MPDFVQGDATIHYELLGAGSPLLMIPGIGSDGAALTRLYELLAGRRQVIVIHNRGAGRTRSKGPITISNMLADCIALLDHLVLAEADVVGHSMGGMIGLRLAARYPHRVRRLAMVAVTPSMNLKQTLLFDEQARLKHEMPPERWFEQIFQWLLSERFFSDRAKVAAAAEASAAYPYAMTAEDFTRQVEALKTFGAIEPATVGCPVLAVAAEEDIMFPAASVVAAASAFPNHHVEVIPGAAHSVALEAPDQLAKAITDFLE